MRLKRNKHFKPEVSTSSLNDIMFFLLLFFLIVSTLSNPNVIKLLLPSAKASQNITKQQITISVTENKLYYIDNKQVTIDKLESELQSKIRNIQEPTVVLRFAYDLKVQDLVDILEIGTRLKIKMVLATTKKGDS